MIPYISIDIETTGLDPAKCQVLEFGAVYDDGVRDIDDLPAFQTYLRHEQIVGQPFALSMHGEILRTIANSHPSQSIIDPTHLDYAFDRWLGQIGIKHRANSSKIQAAGKNFASFDLQFLRPLLPSVQFRHRFIDPAMLYWDPQRDDELPSTEECLKRAGLPSDVKHTALEDAYQVVRLIRHKVGQCG